MTIFIQIAAYKDPELSSTIASALSQAKYPNSLSFGICYQHSELWRSIEALAFPNVRVTVVRGDQNHGMCWARAKTQHLWDGEEYTLQIDSHMRFVEHWDEKLIAMLHNCNSSKPILSAQAPNYTPPLALDHHSLCRIGAKEFWGEYKILVPKAGDSLEGYSKPASGFLLVGHFIFSLGEWIEEVPYDPNIYFIGEEITLAVRSFTSGWDIFYPNQTICYHRYSREGRAKHWDDHSLWWEKDRRSQLRCRQILGMDQMTEDLGFYGLGSVRSFEEHQRFSGINFKQQTLTDSAKRGIPNVV